LCRRSAAIKRESEYGRVSPTQATDGLQQDEESLGRTAAIEADLNMRYWTVHAEAANETAQYQAFLIDLSRMKARRDIYHTSREMLIQRLNKLTADFQIADAEYRLKLNQALPLRDFMRTANSTDADLGNRRQTAIDAGIVARAAVLEESDGLQRAVKELEGLNEYLRSVEGQLKHVVGASHSR